MAKTLAQWIVDAGKHFGVGQAIDDRAEKIIAPVKNTKPVKNAAPVVPPPPPAPPAKAILNGDELLNFYKQVIFNDAQPQDVSFGNQLISFEPSASTAPVASGYPGEIYQTLLGGKPKHKPVSKPRPLF